MLCAGTGCVASGTMKVKAALQEELKKRGLEEEIKLVLTGCNGYCAEGPVVVVHPDEVFYRKSLLKRFPLWLKNIFSRAGPTRN